MKDCEGQSELASLPPLLQRIYTARNITCRAELDLSFARLHHYQSLKDIDKAVTLLITALQHQRRITIVGDFDADGATSCTVAIKALKAMGAHCVNFIVPNRFDFGYGLSPAIVDLAHQQQQPDLLITVDNGIASHAGVLRAHELGIKVLITDHHLPGDTLPVADAIVNPNQAGDSFPSKNLAGVGVIFYLLLALRARLIELHWFEEQGITVPNMAEFLDVVALGTVADLVSLDQNNRILVHHGLQRIRQGRCCLGIKALLQLAGRQISQIKTDDLGYAVAPRLNAAGRLDDITVGILCLLAEDKGSANQLARQLDDLNKQRRDVQEKMLQQAFVAIEHYPKTHWQYLHGICLYHPDWHEGIVGLVASQIKEKFQKPAVAFAKTKDKHLKGSARSVSGLHIRDILTVLATRYPHVITKFGGHAMAAGLSVPEAHFQQFAEYFNEIVTEQLAHTDLTENSIIDGELSSTQLSLPTAELLSQAGPWGMGFPPPRFRGTFNILNQQIVGQHHLRLSLQSGDGPFPVQAIAFNIDKNDWPNYHCEKVEITYQLDINQYNGRQQLQLLVETLAAE